MSYKKQNISTGKAVGRTSNAKAASKEDTAELTRQIESYIDYKLDAVVTKEVQDHRKDIFDELAQVRLQSQKQIQAFGRGEWHESMADMYHVYGQPATGYAGPWHPGYGGYGHGRDGRYGSPYARGYGDLYGRHPGFAGPYAAPEHHLTQAAYVHQVSRAVGKPKRLANSPDRSIRKERQQVDSFRSDSDYEEAQKQIQVKAHYPVGGNKQVTRTTWTRRSDAGYNPDSSNNDEKKDTRVSISKFHADRQSPQASPSSPRRDTSNPSAFKASQPAVQKPNGLSIRKVYTIAYQDQKPGTSGLRKKVTVFKQEHYLENFVQSIFNSLPKEEYYGKSFVVSGDGRYHNDEATQTVIQIAFSNGVREVVVGQHCLLSTPAISAMIRQLNADHGQGYCFGGIVLSASHNPGGPTEDFGIKFNGANGGPAIESVTNEIYAQSLKIQYYTKINGYEKIDTDTIGEYRLPEVEGSLLQHVVKVVDNSEQYVNLMKQLFDFDQIRRLIARRDFRMCFDAMHGVAAPYANRIFGELFGVKDLMRCEVLEDFGKGHPDPNLTYAKELVEKMGIFKQDSNAALFPDFGAACDGDADRNMILGRQFFVTPSDSVAIIVANYMDIPYLRAGISGAARSMPTSGAVDMVLKQMGKDCYETPTGWKFFGNLLDAGSIHICGEESFGTGSSHVREKDGIWAVLAWLQILAAKNSNPNQPLVTVEQIVKDHWQKYGRNYYRRYDYENLETAAADKVFAQIESQFKQFESEGKGNTASNFSYTDPIDGSVSNNQGYIFKYADGSRFVFRKSGTGSSGATIRVYLEKYSKQANQDVTVALKAISDRALALCRLHELTGRKEPTVIT